MRVTLTGTYKAALEQLYKNHVSAGNALKECPDFAMKCSTVMYRYTLMVAFATMCLLCPPGYAQNIDISRATRMVKSSELLDQLHEDIRLNEAQDQTRIVGGYEAEPHEFPHQVGIFISLPENKTSFCGGSLISSEWVLTAAHCADSAYKFLVILGAHHIREKESSQQRFTSDYKVVHPDWNPKSNVNDLALIKLPTPATLNEYVQLVRLPSQGQLTDKFWGKEATMSGWGKDKDSAASIAPVLRKTNDRIVSNAYCSSRYLFVLVKDTNICTNGLLFKGTCNGDSGGPLTVPDYDGKPLQVGITSFGITLGCEKTWPPAFTRVTSYMPWISKETGVEIRK